MLVLLLTGLLALFSHGQASVIVGRRTIINYNSQCATWNDPVQNMGKVVDECCPIDATFPGSPWQQLSLSYVNMGSMSHFGGNTEGGCAGPGGYTVIAERILDDGSGVVGIEHDIEMGLLQMTKREEWHYNEQEVLITFRVKYTKPKFMTNCQPIYNLTVMHAVDPDQDLQPFMTFQTLNDVIFNGGTGWYAEAVGPRSCLAMGYGICTNRNLTDGTSESVGFTNWVPTTPTTLTDPDGQPADITLHYQHVETRPMFCGDEREFRFFAVWGKCYSDARQNFLKAHNRYCLPCIKRQHLVTPPYPRCEGKCPCTSHNANCTCTYMCPTCVPTTPADREIAKEELDAMMGKCGRRKRRQVGSPLPNVEKITLALKDCDYVEREREYMDSPSTAIPGYYCDPTTETPSMGTYYETTETPSMGTYYDTTTMGTYYDTTTMETYYPSETTPTPTSETVTPTFETTSPTYETSSPTYETSSPTYETSSPTFETTHYETTRETTYETSPTVFTDVVSPSPTGDYYYYVYSAEKRKKRQLHKKRSEAVARFKAYVKKLLESKKPAV